MIRSRGDSVEASTLDPPVETTGGQEVLLLEGLPLGIVGENISTVAIRTNLRCFNWSFQRKNDPVVQGETPSRHRRTGGSGAFARRVSVGDRWRRHQYRCNMNKGQICVVSPNRSQGKMIQSCGDSVEASILTNGGIKSSCPMGFRWQLFATTSISFRSIVSEEK